jgi:DNA polymerase-3 subunit alpha
MESKAHNDYVSFKFGLKEPEYDYGLYEVTKSTYGLYIYQEQVMQAMQVLGGMDLVTADNIRKAMGKKKIDLILKYKVQFLEGAVGNGCDRIDAESIWNKLEAFAKYGFNRSHAAAYTYIGLVCQWLKNEYPLEFWTTAFEWAKDTDTSRFVSELGKLNNGVSIVPPDVNKSFPKFTSDKNTGKIYWSIGKIKFAGETATDALLNEREEGGDFYSFEEFYTRVPSKVNKRIIENLIFAGCFDELEGIEDPRNRSHLLVELYRLAKTPVKNRFDLPTQKGFKWWWVKKQKEVSGLGNIDFESLIIKSNLKAYSSTYVDPIQLQSSELVGKQVLIGGTVSEYKIKKTRKGDEFCIMQLECNAEIIHVVMWNEVWSKVKPALESSDQGVLVLSGEVKVDTYKKCNAIQTVRSSKFQIF